MCGIVTRLLLIVVSLITLGAIRSLAAINDYYVSTSGNDLNDGSALHPWATIQHASNLVTPGSTAHVAAGIYRVNMASGTDAAITSNISGTANSRIRFISDTKWAAKIVTSGSTTSWRVNGNYVDIMGFDITGDGRIGIELYGSNQRAVGNIVHNLPITACDSTGGAGIVSGNYAASNNEILANVVHDIGTPGACTSIQGIYYSMYGGHVQNNIVYRVAEWGISTWHAATNVQISNNLVFGNGAGILVGAGDSPGGVINDNTIVSNNIVYKNLSTAIREQGSTGTRNQYLNNLLFGNGGGVLLQNGNTASSTISADPQFVNFQPDGTGDYHLKSTSPAIDKGTSVAAPQNDFDNAARPAGATWDIGPYEANSAPGVWPWE